MALSEEVVDEYKTSLADLNFNSKPLINMLTMLAEDHEQHAPEIVKVIEDHMNKCTQQRKLPALYLTDSIMKNLEKSSYRSLFSRNIVQTFTSVFEQVDEKTRASMFKLRQTWSSILSNATLYRIDKKINSLLDPAWPITATEPEQTSIHVNPRFLQGMGSESERSSPEVTEEPPEDSEDQETLIRQQLIEKQQELLRLKQARLELELAETAEKLKRKPGAKGQPAVASSTATPLGLPMPSIEDSLPLPEIAAKPKDPRPRPTDPRRRDPRLQNQIVSSPSAVQSSVTGPKQVVAQLHGHGAVPNTSSVPGLPRSSHSTFPPASSRGPFSVSQMPPASMIPFHEPGQALGSLPPYNGLQGQGMPYQPIVGMPPNIPSQVFSGEVFIQDDGAIFSDENDSDSSRSSIQGQNNTKHPAQSNIRDPRHRIENKRNTKDPQVEHKSGHHDRRRNDKPINRNSNEKRVTSVKDTHRDTKDPRLSDGRETQEKRKSKDREMHVSPKLTKESVPDSPRKSASGQQAPKHRSASKDRESKSETKLKGSFEAERKRKEEEIKRAEIKSSRKIEEKRPDKQKERTSRERERSPQQSSKQYSTRSRDFRGAGDRKSEKKYEGKKEHKTLVTAANRKIIDKTIDKKAGKISVVRGKESTSKLNVEPMDIDERVRPAKEAEKRLSSDREIHERMAKKPKLEEPLPETAGDSDGKMSDFAEKTSVLDIKSSNAAERLKNPEEQDVNIKEEDMDIESEPEPATESDAPKIDTDFSDLFGGEDEDYRPAVQKQQLPLKSPSCKGWDQFKASQPDQYAYDIELKKQRQDSVVETTGVGPEDEPQDEDLRVHQSEFQQQLSIVDEPSIPEELAMNQHAEILLKAHKQLKEGQISQEQYQELLKQLTELITIQKLQEENRRLSSEMHPSQEQVTSTDLQTMSSPPCQSEQVMPEQSQLREVRSPERPLDTFKIPKKSKREKAEEDRRKELSNLYPESPQDRYRGHGPLTGRDNKNRHDGEVHPFKHDSDEREHSFEDRSWKENQESWRQPHDDYNERAPSAYRKGQDISESPQDRFAVPLEHGGPRSGDPGRSSPRENLVENYTDRRIDKLDGPPDNFEERTQKPDGPQDGFDNRRPRPDGLPDDFDGRKARPESMPDDFDGRWVRESNYDCRGPQDRFESIPEARGPHRDRRSDNWPERRGPDIQSDQRGEWNRDRRGRDEGDRRERDEEFFNGPLERFSDEDRRRSGKQNWRDSRKSGKWRDQEDANFEKRGGHERFPDSRGPPGRFREGRNIDQRGPNEPNNFPDGRGGPHDHLGRDRSGRPHDRLEGPPDERRSWKDEDGPQSWDDLRKGKVEGPFGRPGPPSEGSKPWLPPGQRNDSPKKEPWRGHPDNKLNERPRSHRHGRSGDRHDEEEYEPAFMEKAKPKPLMSLLDPLPPRPPPGLRGTLGNPDMKGHGLRGPQRFESPEPDGPSSMNRPSGPFQSQVDSYVDKFGDPRFRCFVEMGPEVSEEVVIGKRNFEIKLGAPPRKIAWGKDFVEVFADPSKRGVVIDKTLMYKFGERVKDVTIRGRKEKLFYHGRPLNLWVDGQHFEVRVDAPPKSINIDGKVHKIQVDGRDMMILIDKEEKGRYGGPPRFVFVDEERKEIRFDPPPRHIIIDGQPCELKLNMLQPCVSIKGVLHGIRFDGPPRDVFINGKLYQIFTDHAVKIRVGNRFHYVALGGPCHEVIVDGKWFEMKFNEAPKEVNVGNQVLMVRLPGSPPEVKILPEIAQEPRPIHAGMQGSMQPPGMMQGPGPMGFAGPRQNMGPGMSIPGVGPPGMLPMQHQPGPMQGPQMNIQPSSAPSLPLSGPPMIPGIGQPLPAGAPVTQPSGMPNVLSSLFPAMAATSSASAPIDVKSLFDKLVNTGIIKKDEPDIKPDVKPVTTKADIAKPQEYIVPQKKAPKQEKFADIPDMTEMNVSEMKSLPVGMVQRLYAGLQCTSCGERFEMKDGEKTEKYRQHLDWHFRQNRKGKTDTKLTSCRKWYYPISDWMQYEEVTDSKETGKSSFFEQQQQQQPVDTTPAKNPLMLVVPEGVSAIKCPAAAGDDNEDMCNICHEVFEQYWDEELEEWHLRDAIKVNNKTYHPICYEDHTDVSEGTPSPSVLSVTEPGFMSRKSLAYDEASQDGHHASFEEERNISTSITEPMETAAASESSALNASIKTEPIDDSENVGSAKINQEPATNIKHEPITVIKQEPVTEINQEPVTEINQEPVIEIQQEPATEIQQEPVTKIQQEPVTEIKQEPVTEIQQEPATEIQQEPIMEVDQVNNISQSEGNESHSVVVKQKPSDVLENIHVSEIDNFPHPSVEIKTEPVDRTSEQESDNGPVEESEKNEEMPMECSSSNVFETAVTVKSEPESDPESAIPEAQKAVTDTQSKPEEKEEDRVAESELETESSTQPKTNTEISTSGIHVSTNSSHLAPPDDQEACDIQHSPTYSKLSKITLVIPQENADITPEVFEIGSNASTPTQDELPCPWEES